MPLTRTHETALRRAAPEAGRVRVEAYGSDDRDDAIGGVGSVVNGTPIYRFADAPVEAAELQAPPHAPDLPLVGPDALRFSVGESRAGFGRLRQPATGAAAVGLAVAAEVAPIALGSAALPEGQRRLHVVAEGTDAAATMAPGESWRWPLLIKPGERTVLPAPRLSATPAESLGLYDGLARLEGKVQRTPLTGQRVLFWMEAALRQVQQLPVLIALDAWPERADGSAAAYDPSHPNGIRFAGEVVDVDPSGPAPGGYGDQAEIMDRLLRAFALVCYLDPSEELVGGVPGPRWVVRPRARAGEAVTGCQFDALGAFSHPVTLPGRTLALPRFGVVPEPENVVRAAGRVTVEPAEGTEYNLVNDPAFAHYEAGAYDYWRTDAGSPSGPALSLGDALSQRLIAVQAAPGVGVLVEAFGFLDDSADGTVGYVDAFVADGAGGETLLTSAPIDATLIRATAERLSFADTAGIPSAGELGVRVRWTSSDAGSSSLVVRVRFADAAGDVVTGWETVVEAGAGEAVTVKAPPPFTATYGTPQAPEERAPEAWRWLRGGGAYNTLGEITVAELVQQRGRVLRAPRVEVPGLVHPGTRIDVPAGSGTGLDGASYVVTGAEYAVRRRTGTSTVRLCELPPPSP